MVLPELMFRREKWVERASRRLSERWHAARGPPTEPLDPVVGATPRARALCTAADPVPADGDRDGQLPLPRGARERRWLASTLRQACPEDEPRAQYAFKDSMIHGILQFTLDVAFRCVLHRCGSQDIRC